MNGLELEVVYFKFAISTYASKLAKTTQDTRKWRCMFRNPI